MTTFKVLPSVLEICHENTLYRFPLSVVEAANLSKALGRIESLRKNLERFERDVAAAREKIVRGEEVCFDKFYPPA